jgi:hypothetical protein
MDPRTMKKKTKMIVPMKETSVALDIIYIICICVVVDGILSEQQRG